MTALTTLALSEDEVLVRDVAQRFFHAHAQSHGLKSRLERRETGIGTLWALMAGAGFTGALSSEAFGGSAMGHAAAAQILEAQAGAASASPFLSTAVLATRAIALIADAHQCEALLSPIAAGEAVWACAFDDGSRHQPGSVTARATTQGDGWRLSGLKPLVHDANSARHLLVLAAADDGLSFFIVDAGQPGVVIEPLQTLDGSDAGRVQLANVAISGSRRLGGRPVTADEYDAVLDSGRALLAAELVGLAQRSFDLTIDYLLTREQFGVKIGTFQALQHRAAQLYAEIEMARSISLSALRALDSGSKDAGLLVSAAKAKAGSVARLATNEAMQLHGGIAMTSAVDIHLYLRRAYVARLWLGDEGFHADRVARLLGF